MSEPTSCCRARGGYCERCDVLVGLDGLRMIGVDRDDGGALTGTVESELTDMRCPVCGSSRTATAGSWWAWSTPGRWTDRPDPLACVALGPAVALSRAP